MSLPVLEDRKFLGNVVIDGTTTLTGATTQTGALSAGAATFSSTVGITGTLTAPEVLQAIADPGDGVAIPVTQSGMIPITTAAAETNTLAIPTFVGAKLILICDVHAVGDRVVTAAVKVNQAGNTIMRFGAAGDMIVLEAVQEAGTLRWQVTHNDGVALS